MGSGNMHKIFGIEALKFLLAVAMIWPVAYLSLPAAWAQDNPQEEPSDEEASSKPSSSFEFESVTKRWKNLRKPYAVVATKDSKQLYFSAYENGGIGIFQRDKETGTIANEAVLDVEQGMICLDLSADETRAVGCSYTNGLHLFDRNAEDGNLTELFHFEIDHEDEDEESLSRPISLAMSPDGRFVYVVDELRSALFVYQVTKENELVFVQQHNGIDGCLRRARLIATDSTGEKLFVTGNEKGALAVFDRDPKAGHVRMLSYAIDGENGVSKLGGAHGVALSHDDRFVYVVCGRFEGDQSICVFELQQDDGALNLVQEWEPTAANPFSGGSHIGVSPDGRHVVATAWETKNIAHFLRDPKTGKIKFHEFCLFNGKVKVGQTTQPYFSPDGKFFYLGSASGNVLTYKN